MSSATSTKSLPAEGGGSDSAFRAGHFFILMSLIGATAAVVMARQATPEHLILISLTIGSAGAAAFGVYRTLAPLTATDSELATEPISERLRADLEREKQLVLRSIKELEFDKAMGKVSPADFDEMVGRLRTRAIGIMKQLDQGGSAYRTVIEKELAARLGRAVTLPPPVAQGLSQARAGLCTCGTQNDSDAKFCKSCGNKL